VLIDYLSIYIMHHICIENFNYTVFKVFVGTCVCTVHVMSYDLRLRLRVWLTQGGMTSCARFDTVSDYHI
jgi:hypothetical protein